MNYNYFYEQTGFYFGDKPSFALVEYITKYNIMPCLVVDIGAGEGRNSFYLVKKGFTVVAIEPSDLGVKKMIDYIKREKLHLDVIKSDFFNGVKEISNIDFFVASTVLDQMSEIEIIQAKTEIYNKLRINGYVFASAFTRDDPGFLKKDTQHISECGGTVKHYFRKNELRELFSDFKILEYEEKYFEDLTHGNPHYHSIAILLAQK